MVKLLNLKNWYIFKVVSSLAFLSFLFFFMSFNSFAHEVKPAIIEVLFKDKNNFEIRIKLSLETLLANMSSLKTSSGHISNSNLYNQLRDLPSEDLKKNFQAHSKDFLNGIRLIANETQQKLKLINVTIPKVGDQNISRLSTLTLKGRITQKIDSFTWGWSTRFGANIIRLRQANTRSDQAGKIIFSAYLRNGKQSSSISLKSARPNNLTNHFIEYIKIGFTHIIPKGLDHILFVIALFLLTTEMLPLLWQITSFTFAHTISLALSSLSIISLPADIVEPLIAISIIFVSIDNIFTEKLHLRRPVIIFIFGLFHGLGFAEILRHVGLSKTHFISNLIAFNIGVELGQLCIIIICLLSVGVWCGHKNWYRKIVVIPASFVITLISFWWFIKRINFF